MALIKCPECGKEVSDKAPSCTQCGFPIAEKPETSLSRKVEGIIGHQAYWRKSKAGQIGVWMCIVGLALAIFGLTVPWWTITFHNNITQEGTLNATDNLHYGIGGSSGGVSGSIVDNGYQFEPKVRSVFNIVKLAVFFVLLFGLVSLISHLMAGSTIKQSMLPGLLGILAFLTSLAPPLYTAFFLPDSVNHTQFLGYFFFSEISGFIGYFSGFLNTGLSSITWGPNFGWLVEIIASIAFLIAGLAMWRSTRLHQR